MNKLAVSMFMLAFQTKELMGTIDSTVTDKYEGGIAKDIVDELLNDYQQPKDAITGVEAEMALLKLEFHRKRNPKKVFKRIGVLKA